MPMVYLRSALPHARVPTVWQDGPTAHTFALHAWRLGRIELTVVPCPSGQTSCGIPDYVPSYLI